jgi:hypothetical protein
MDEVNLFPECNEKLASRAIKSNSVWENQHAYVFQQFQTSKAFTILKIALSVHG